MRKTKYFLAGFLIAAILFSTNNVFASTHNQTISVTYDDIEIYVNGKRLAAKGPDGHYTDLFFYKYSTYAPARAIADALNIPVRWDEKTKSVYIGAKIKLIIDDFKSIKRGMTIDEVEAIVGRENVSLGSGNLILGYYLENGEVMIIHYEPKTAQGPDCVYLMRLQHPDGSYTPIISPQG